MELQSTNKLVCMPAGQGNFTAVPFLIPVAKSDALQTVALNVPRYAATLALYILITQACSNFYNFSSVSYHGNITYKSVRYKLNETSEKTQGR